MMPCRIVRRHLDALVDGELDTSAQVEFDTHLASCPICRDQAAFSRSVKRTIKAELGSVKAPDRLRFRVLTALESSPQHPLSRSSEAEPAASEPRAERRSERSGVRVWMLPARYAVPAAAAAVLFVAIGAQTDDGDADDAAVAATTVPLFEDVVRRHSSEHPAEVAGPPQQVVGWFRGKLEFPVRPVEFESESARLLGARLSNVRERDAAAFYYEVRGHRVTVVVFEPPARSAFAGAMPGQPFVGAQHVNVHGRDLYYRQVRGYTVPVRQYDGLTYAFTGDLDRQAMIQLAASARVTH
ncbi:MAG: zf-HC2 domain-containing protein [Myxococcota bacterium]|nr:zf-HC2 domain-containing protein [Myxococcota bacterium]